MLDLHVHVLVWFFTCTWSHTCIENDSTTIFLSQVRMTMCLWHSLRINPIILHCSRPLLYCTIPDPLLYYMYTVPDPLL